MKRTVIILTASSKYGNFCVAGIDVFTGEWVRLVSDDVSIHGALTPADMLCTNGCVCEVLDTVDVEIEKAVPSVYQPENLLIKKGVSMKFRKKAPFDYVLKIHPPENSRLLYNNKRNFLYEKEFNYISQSLMLIKAENLILQRKKNTRGKYKYKASFTYNGVEYTDIAMTDPKYYSKPDGFTFSSAYIVVSLPDIAYANGLYYKFLARIFPEIGCKTCITPCPEEEKSSVREKTDNKKSYVERRKELFEQGKTAANSPWSDEEENMLKSEFENGLSTEEMADIHKRTEGGIISRLKKLGLY